jgi:hypothetical protein
MEIFLSQFSRFHNCVVDMYVTCYLQALQRVFLSTYSMRYKIFSILNLTWSPFPGKNECFEIGGR